MFQFNCHLAVAFRGEEEGVGGVLQAGRRRTQLAFYMIFFYMKTKVEFLALLYHFILVSVLGHEAMRILHVKRRHSFCFSVEHIEDKLC